MHAANLKDSNTKASYNSIQETIEKALEKRIKKESYFKVKSGPLLSINLERDNDEIVDSISQQPPKISAEKYAKSQLDGLQRLVNKILFADKMWALPFIKNSNNYTISNEGIVYDQRLPAYKIQFLSLIHI